MIGRSHYEIFPEIPEHWKEIHRRCLAGAVEKAIEDPFPRANGTLDWIRWKIHPWYQNDAQVGGILLLSEVITERKQSELALRDSQEKFFQPFTQLDSALSRQYEGAGLSLALVSRLVERMGGRIGVESEPG